MTTSRKLALILDSHLTQFQGGAELQADFVAREALRQHWKTHYCFLSCQNHPAMHMGTTLHAIRQNRIWTKLNNIKYPYAFRLLNELKQIRPTAIYQRCGLSFTGIAAHYAKRNNCRFIFHIAHDRDLHPPHYSLKRPHLVPERMLMHSGIKNADTVIAQTQFQAEQLLKVYGKPAIVIPNGHPVPPDVPKDDTTTILWIANWKALKQPEIFIRLVQSLKSRKNARFIMLGRNKTYPELTNAARRSGIQVMGEISHTNVNELVSRSHILINTSLQEGFSNTFIQAWMRRVPVVSLSVDPDHVIRKNNLGFCTENFPELVRVTEKLISKPALLTQMGADARQYAHAHYSLENMKKVVNVINGR